VSNPEEVIPAQLQAGACPWVTGGWDASADARPDATEDAYREPQTYPDGAEKLADQVLDVQEPGAQFRAEQLKLLVPEAPCTPDEVRCAERSCAAAAFVYAAAQPAPLVWWPLESGAGPAHSARAQLKLESPPASPEPSLLLERRAGGGRPEVGPQMLVAEQLVALEPKRLVLLESLEQPAAVAEPQRGWGLAVLRWRPEGLPGKR